MKDSTFMIHTNSTSTFSFPTPTSQYSLFKQILTIPSIMSSYT